MPEWAGMLKVCCGLSVAPWDSKKNDEGKVGNNQPWLFKKCSGTAGPKWQQRRSTGLQCSKGRRLLTPHSPLEHILSSCLALCSRSTSGNSCGGWPQSSSMRSGKC